MDKTIRWMWILIIGVWAFFLASIIAGEFSLTARIILVCCECACIVAVLVLIIVEWINQEREAKRLEKEFDKRAEEWVKTIEKIEKEPFKVIDIDEDKKE